MLQQLRHAGRALRRNPTFSLIVVATFALGIGMNAAVFSVANAVLFRAVPYPDAERLVWLANFSRTTNRDLFTAYAEYRFWQTHTTSFGRMAGYGDDDFALVAGDQASQERIACVTGDFWAITGAHASAGRLFGAREANQLVLTWDLFSRRFGGDRNVIGTTVMLDGHSFQIAGVLDRGFRFAFPQQYVPGDEVRDIDGFVAIPDIVLSLPTPLSAIRWEEARQQAGPTVPNVNVIGQLKAGVAFGQAATEMQALFPAFPSDKPFQSDHALSVVPLGDKIGRSERRPLFVLLASSGFVLLIACANIAGLFIARRTALQRDAAIRSALGASKIQLLCLPLFECLSLAAAGGAAGLLIARGSLRFLTGVALGGGRQIGFVPIDARVLWFTAAITLITGLLAGLAPNLSFQRLALVNTLRAGSPSGRSHRLRGRGALVATQIGLAIVLLTGAGLMLKSLWQMQRRPDGFVPENVLSMRVMLSGPRYNGWLPKVNYANDLLQSARSLPGVLAAGVDAGTLNTTVELGPGARVGAAIRAVSPGYLQAIGVPLLRGQWPKDDDWNGVIVNEAFARMAGGDVVGRAVSGSILNDTIVGVVADFRVQQLDANPLPEVYMPYQRIGRSRSIRVLVRSSGPATALATPVHDLLVRADPTQPAYEFQSLDQALANSIAPRRFQLTLLAAFAGSALMLALIGLNGMMAGSVTERTREIGVRLALGASPAAIVRLVVQQGMWLAAIGVVSGLAAAAGLTRVMAGLLFGVAPSDLQTFALAAGTLAAAALAACWVPARRAARVDPIVALRGD